MQNAAHYVCDVLRNVDKSNLSVTHTVIVPDRASLEAEKALLRAVGGSFNVRVRTFRRLANEILPKYNYLSKQAGIMALAGIIQDCKQQMQCYTKGLTPGFVADMYDTISMMKYCRVTPQMLLSANLPKSVAAKAHDMAVLFEGYLNFTKDKFIDSADKLELLCQCINQNQSIKDGYFYLYDFDNFSVQELALVEQLMLFSKGVTVACCTGQVDDSHLFLNDIFDGVMNLCRKNNITPQIVEQRGYSNQFTRQIGENLFRFKKAAPVEGFAEIFCGATRAQEVYALACRISQYVRSGGRYKDVYVVTSDVDKYSNSISLVFDELEIPYFCDRRFNLANHPYAQFVVDFLTLCKNNCKAEFVLPFVKNHLFCGFWEDSQQNDVFHFENYCLKYNASYDFSEFRLGKDEPYFDSAERVRQQFFQLYAQAQIPQEGTAMQFVDAVRNLIALAKLDEKNALFAQQQQAKGLAYQSKVTVQVQQKFADVLTQAQTVLDQRQMKLEEFLRLFCAALCSVNISVIPVANDCVVFANMAKARKHDVKFLALLGANYGAMPIVKRDGKLLSDSNLRDLAAANILLEPQILTENRREKFSLFQLLHEPTQVLYVSYPLADGADQLVPSTFVTELQKLFCRNGKLLQPATETDERAYTQKQAVAKIVLNRRRLKDNRQVKMPSFEVLSKHFGNLADNYMFDEKCNFSINNGKQFYLAQAQTSVSKITDFYKCPYKFFFEYGLRIKPRPVAQPDPSDMGNILHDVLEHYVREMNETESDLTTVESAKKHFENAVANDYYKAMRNDKKLRGVLLQLQQESVRMCLVVKKQFAFSKFRKFRTELSFGGQGSDAPAVEVDYGNGKFLLIGKIDRLDVFEQKNQFVVIDYKSSTTSANFNEKDLYNGQKLQLPVYVMATQNQFGMQPVGFYYFAMHDTFSSQEDDYVYNGRTLEDVDVAMALDSNLSKGKSKKLGLRLKSGGLLVSSSRLLSENQMQCYLRYTTKMIQQAGKLLSEGYANVSPYEGACSYCDYKDICDFNDVWVFSPRKVKEDVKKKDIEEIVTSWATPKNNKT